jgi:peptidoglycan/xylan/chitin deacetylase (PgdA/CDA1 family)
MVLGVGVMVMLRAGGGERATADRPAATLGVAASDTTRRVPVLCYHYVRDPGGPLHFARVFGYVVLSLPLLGDSQLWNVSARGFERQMEYLHARGYQTVTLDDVHEWQHGRRELPPKPVVITFDDGDVSVRDEALPVLERFGFKATLFLVTARVGTRWGEVECLDWSALRAMRQSGVFEIESHTDDLHYKVTHQGDVLPVFIAASERAYRIDGRDAWHDVVLDDLVRSRLAIQLNLGRAPSYLAWPYGFGNPALDRLAARAGFRRTCALRAGSFVAPSDDDGPMQFEIPRYAVTARTSLRDFRAMLEGTYRPGS